VLMMTTKEVLRSVYSFSVGGIRGALACERAHCFHDKRGVCSFCLATRYGGATGWIATPAGQLWKQTRDIGNDPRKEHAVKSVQLKVSGAQRDISGRIASRELKRLVFEKMCWLALVGQVPPGQGEARGRGQGQGGGAQGQGRGAQGGAR